MARQAELTAAILQKVPPSFVLSEIARALPPQVSLSDLAFAAGDEPTSHDLRLTVNGAAPSDAQIDHALAGRD